MKNLRAFKGILPKIAANSYIDPHAIVIGDVEVGDDSSVWPTAVLRGDVHRIRIGKGTSIQDGAIGHVSHDGPYAPGGHALTVGNFVTVGHQVVMHGCTIGDYCLIGMQSLILDGAILQSHVMLGAGSLVSPGKVLESGFLYVGRPAVQKRALTANEMAFLQYSAESYIKLKNDYLAMQG